MMTYPYPTQRNIRNILGRKSKVFMGNHVGLANLKISFFFFPNSFVLCANTEIIILFLASNHQHPSRLHVRTLGSFIFNAHVRIVPTSFCLGSNYVLYIHLSPDQFFQILRFSSPLFRGNNDD